MNSNRGNIFTNLTCAVAASFLIPVSLLINTDAQSGAKKLTVAISPDLPPYVLKKATGGLEVDLLREALPGHTLNFIQMPYADLQTAVSSKRADVSVGVEHFTEDGGFYSDDFVTFENAAIARKAADLKIENIRDLANHKVLTWQDAYLELGPEFKSLFSPDSQYRKNYVEFGDQREQVRMFWRDRDSIAVIDRSIFIYFSREMKHSLNDVVFHSLFPPHTNFKVGFKDAALRDHFNQGLTKMCKSGEYAKLLKRYEIELQRTVCDK